MASDSRRIQFEFAPQAIQRLDALRSLSGATSYAEVVRDAIRLLEWYLEQRAMGYELGVVKDCQLVKVVQIMF